MSMESILYKGQIKDDPIIKQEADTIVTAVIIGFAATRYYLNQPFSFDIEHPTPDQFRKWTELDRMTDDERKRLNKDDAKAYEKYEEFLREYGQFEEMMSGLSLLMDNYMPGMGNAVKDRQSPAFHEGALITGHSGGAGVVPTSRHCTIDNRWAQRFAKSVKEDPTAFQVYSGRGAYTGMIDDPVDDELYVHATIRVIDSNQLRWHPNPNNRLNPEKLGGTEFDKWGLIQPYNSKENKYVKVKGNGDSEEVLINLSNDLTKGMGPLPDSPASRALKEGKARIGYIHGMSSAIQAALRIGPWVTPFEMATGKETTKMASCFACTTYMYAAGYPPSSTHLGRGESWILPSTEYAIGTAGSSLEKDELTLGSYKPDTIRSVASRWHRDIHAYIKLGTTILIQALDQSRDDRANLVDSQYKAVIQQTQKVNNEIILVDKKGGNLFLDALTVHESDWKRVRLVLAPAVDPKNQLQFAITEKKKEIEAIKKQIKDL